MYGIRWPPVMWAVAGLVIVASVAYVLYSFLGALVVGLFFYYALRPVYRWVGARLSNPTVSATATLVAAGIPLLVVLAYAVLVGVREAGGDPVALYRDDDGELHTRSGSVLTWAVSSLGTTASSPGTVPVTAPASVSTARCLPRRRSTDLTMSRCRTRTYNRLVAEKGPRGQGLTGPAWVRSRCGGEGGAPLVVALLW